MALAEAEVRKVFGANRLGLRACLACGVSPPGGV
jgi:hypothetical protein